MGVAAEADINYTIPARMFVQLMPRIDLIKCAFRANMCTTERENKASGLENGGKHNDKI